MNTPKWIEDQVVHAIHNEQLAEHGGLAGIRDAKLLQSALDAPKNAYHDEKAGLFKLAALYGYRISNNQPFIDGNKRTAYVVSRLFLMLNGYDIRATEMERVQIFLAISANIMSEANLEKWIKQRSTLLIP